MKGHRILAQIWLAALALPAGCGSPTPEDWLVRLRKNPTDTEAAAKLAIEGKPASPLVIRFLEESEGGPEGTTRRQVACAVLAAAGDVGTESAIEYLDQGTNAATKSRLLKIMASKHWRGAARKLVNRLPHPTLGPDIYTCLCGILAGSEVPPDPFQVEGELREERLAQWNRFVLQNIREFGLPDFRVSHLADTPIDTVKGMIEHESKSGIGD